MSCEGVCYYCKEYKTMKEAHKNCETLKERGRQIRKLSYQAKKRRMAELNNFVPK